MSEIEQSLINYYLEKEIEESELEVLVKEGYLSEGYSLTPTSLELVEKYADYIEFHQLVANLNDYLQTIPMDIDRKQIRESISNMISGTSIMSKTDEDVIDEIIKFAEWNDLEVNTNYSGRGMFGATCLAIYGTRSELESIFSEIPEALNYNRKWDSMGMDYVLYWQDLRSDNG